MTDLLNIKSIRFQFNVLLCIAAILSPTSYAEEETDAERKQRLKDYYVVDFIIFKHNQSSSENLDYPEQWSKNIDFTWPENALMLSNAQLTSVYPELANDINQLQTEAIQSLNKHAGKSNPEKNDLALTTQTFTALAGEASKINRVQRYGLLSHNSWVQKIQANQAAEDILIPIDLKLNNSSDKSEDLMFDIDSSETYVTGTISLRKNRYLHLSTNLMAINLLNAPLINDEPLIEVKTTDLLTSTSNPMDAITEAEEVETLEEKTEAEKIKPWPSIPLKSAALENAYFEKTAKVASDQTPYPLTLPSEYIAQIAQLKQTRRMRSRETHYIDHPLIGLVIRITPLTVILDDRKAQ